MAAWREQRRLRDDADRRDKNPLIGTSEIGIAGVRKHGEGLRLDRRPWTLWIVTSGDGTDYRTFDGVLAHRAFEAVGGRARIEWEWNGYGRDLKSLTVIERSAA